MFQLYSPYRPTGDQPEAIHQLVDGVRAGAEAQTLLGVTGSGKTFTVANVISGINRPTLILSHKLKPSLLILLQALSMVYLHLASHLISTSLLQMVQNAFLVSTS